MINEFKNFKYIEESYLDSNFAPLYHKTTTYDFYKIINENILRTTNIKHPFKNKFIKMVSLTRNPNLDLSYFKLFLDVIIELNKNILIRNYKIIPYDFFIHTGKEKFPKSNTLRKEPFENEEIILSNINNILNFIISVDFKNDSILDRQVAMTIPILRKNNIKIYNNGKIF
jgi:hypothetical protein